jgi:uncharacterized membrane protein YbaN (DUF454 family)
MTSKLTIVFLILVAFFSCKKSSSYKQELIEGGAQDSFLSHFPNNPEIPFKTSFILKPKNDIASDEIFTIYLECNYSDSVILFCEKNAIATYKKVKFMRALVIAISYFYSSPNFVSVDSTSSSSPALTLCQPLSTIKTKHFKKILFLDFI